jgi:hypothetical protein
MDGKSGKNILFVPLNPSLQYSNIPNWDEVPKFTLITLTLLLF